MIKSMTAFARSERQTDAGELVWEIRSVNHRYLELFVRMPDELRAFETSVREQVNKRLNRGKIEAVLRFKASESSVQGINLNEELLAQMKKALHQVSIHISDSKSPTSIEILRWPGVVVPPSRDPEQLQQAVMSLLDKALSQLVETREREGGKLAQMISERTAGCRQQVELARERMPIVIEALRTKLHDKLAEIMQEVDSERVEQEIVIAAQKLDVDEEMDRLLTHLDEIDRVLETGKPVGRRLDFLMQELNREANTLASKSSDKEMTSVAVELKVLIEQMREQVQNIE
jgi:uncharacterized protein (TIGR00255 family)